MSAADNPENSPPDSGQDATARAFGAANRARLLKEYFAEAGSITYSNAWQHVYRLLLWIDRTTALAHCYESDKAQPGRAWYARSLAFHDWLSTALGLSPANLGENIDWLFREAVKDLASKAIASRNDTYSKQRSAYEGQGFPEPGEDPELVGIVKEILGPWMEGRPPEEEFQKLTRRIHVYMGQENKRRNLVGEGFEDVIAGVISRLPVFRNLEIRNRAPLHDCPASMRLHRMRRRKRWTLP